MARLAVISALREEIQPLAERLGTCAPTLPSHTRPARVGEHELVLLVGGEGEENAARSVAALLEGRAIHALIGIGVGGALSPDLEVGDLVVADQVRGRNRVWGIPDSQWKRRGLAARFARAGTLVSSEHIVSRPQDRARLVRRLGEGSAVVDLESSSWARVAGEHRVPFVIARWVSDTANEPLPLDFERLRGRDGAVNRGRVMLAAAGRPSMWPDLLRLRRSVQQAGRELADWVLEVAGANGAMHTRPCRVDPLTEEEQMEMVS